MVAFLVVIAVLVFLFIMWFVYYYNKLVRERNRVDNAWHQIDVQLKRRYDLIPNLVETVKGYAAHEKEVFEKVTQARAMGINARTVGEQAQAENAITQALKTLFAVAENYPDLKANQNFLMLQEELAGTESKIAFARQFYNDSVMAYDTARQRFPGNIVAGMFSGTFTPREYFEIDIAAEREAPKVQF
ncbi:LemA family protein [Candidatus Solincola tengchongensis]|uniref:LemA family protein n=1 Tax=Candidatus Solincola tengchongensis TaxID=2900693 RepID=UPI00257A8EC4|nr:LemA family protein [Candidatus Solincola tengchongensis]